MEKVFDLKITLQDGFELIDEATIQSDSEVGLKKGITQLLMSIKQFGSVMHESDEITFYPAHVISRVTLSPRLVQRVNL